MKQEEAVPMKAEMARFSERRHGKCHSDAGDEPFFFFDFV